MTDDDPCRLLEEKLRRALADAAKANHALDEYATFVSRELQEPLRAVSSFAQLLAHEYGPKLDDDAQKYIRSIVEAAARMRVLIVDVLDYSRVGRDEPPMTEVDLSALVAAVLLDHEHLIRETGARVEVGALPRVTGNPARLAGLLLALLSNALKFRDPARPPVVSISAERSSAEWILAVKDNGIGFDPGLSQKIMRPFHRLHPHDRFPGSGLGLASAKKIADLHGGRLWAESQPGRGSTFFVSLPA